MTNDHRDASALMIATLSADLAGRVPADLVADIVRGVLAENQLAAQDRGVEPTMCEAGDVCRFHHNLVQMNEAPVPAHDAGSGQSLPQTHGWLSSGSWDRTIQRVSAAPSEPE